MDKTIMIGAVAYDPKAVTIWEGIRSFFLSQSVPLDFVLFSNYEAQVEALFQRFIDIAWNTNLAFVQTDLRLNGKANILAMRDTDLGFTSRIIVSKDSSATSLKDLNGKRVAFGSRDSVQAAIIPQFGLRGEGLIADSDYIAIRFDSDVGKHGDTGFSEEQVVESVRSGRADAGCIGESKWTAVTAIGGASSLRSIWQSPPYSHCNFTALPDTDPALTDLFVRTLLKMDYDNPEHRPILEMEGLKRWVEGDRDGYDLVFEAVEATAYLQNVQALVRHH